MLRTASKDSAHYANTSQKRFAVSKRSISFDVEGSVPGKGRTRIDFAQGEAVFLCESYKYTSVGAGMLFDSAGLCVLQEWQVAHNDCSLYLLQLK
jgi:uncharacterized SAM-dependent methyltransferase